MSVFDLSMLPKVALLQTQINRFGYGLPVNGLLDFKTASTAHAIVSDRYGDAFATDPLTAGPKYQEILQYTSNPEPWVKLHIDDITAIIQAYGDSKGKPPARATDAAKPSGLPKLPSDFPYVTLAIGVVATALLAVGAWVINAKLKEQLP